MGHEVLPTCWKSNRRLLIAAGKGLLTKFIPPLWGDGPARTWGTCRVCCLYACNSPHRTGLHGIWGAAAEFVMSVGSQLPCKGLGPSPHRKTASRLVHEPYHLPSCDELQASAGSEQWRGVTELPTKPREGGGPPFGSAQPCQGAQPISARTVAGLSTDVHPLTSGCRSLLFSFSQQSPSKPQSLDRGER